MNSYPLFKIFTDGKDKGTYKGALELDTMRDYVLGAAHFYNPIKCVCWGVYNMQGHVQGCLGVGYDAGLRTRGCPFLQPNQVRMLGCIQYARARTRVPWSSIRCGTSY